MLAGQRAAAFLASPVTNRFELVLMQFDVARASCACVHGRDARATFSNCTSTYWAFLVVVFIIHMVTSRTIVFD